MCMRLGWRTWQAQSALPLATYIYVHEPPRSRATHLQPSPLARQVDCPPGAALPSADADIIGGGQAAFEFRSGSGGRWVGRAALEAAPAVVSVQPAALLTGEQGGGAGRVEEDEEERGGVGRTPGGRCRAARWPRPAVPRAHPAATRPTPALPVLHSLPFLAADPLPRPRTPTHLSLPPSLYLPPPPPPHGCQARPPRLCWWAVACTSRASASTRAAAARTMSSSPLLLVVLPLPLLGMGWSQWRWRCRPFVRRCVCVGGASGEVPEGQRWWCGAVRGRQLRHALPGACPQVPRLARVFLAAGRLARHTPPRPPQLRMPPLCARCWLAACPVPPNDPSPPSLLIPPTHNNPRTHARAGHGGGGGVPGPRAGAVGAAGGVRGQRAGPGGCGVGARRRRGQVRAGHAGAGAHVAHTRTSTHARGLGTRWCCVCL